MKIRLGSSLKFRMTAAFLSAIGLVTAILAVLFIRTTLSLRHNTLDSLNNLAANIDTSITSLLLSIQNTSELLADDPRLIEVLDKDYGAAAQYDKLLDMSMIRDQIFGSVNRAPETTLLTAIYCLETGQLFNFSDANLMDDATIQQLALALQLDMANPPTRTRYNYYWRSLAGNPLNRESEQARNNMVLLGSRWIYNTEKVRYSYIHLYALTERQLYNCYASLISQNGGQVYIVNGNGELLSSSNEEAVAAARAGEAVAGLVFDSSEDSFTTALNGERYYVNIRTRALNNSQDPNNQWITLLMVPTAYAEEELNNLYIAFFFMLLLCFAIAGLMLVLMYRQFMNPISLLSHAMREVDMGNLNAYVPGAGEQNARRSEANRMIGIFNRMLRSINRTMEERMALEQAKQNLDMQVLTSQINPHFLYNTLETIVWRAEQAGRPDIGKIASSLGKLYRLSISGGDLFVPLSQELEHLQSYVDIQRSRYNGRFAFLLSFPNKSLQQVQVPKIILQPIVENIFLYAMPACEQTVAIRVSIRGKSGSLVIKVLDNGLGMNRQQLAAVREQIRTGVPAPGGESRVRRRSSGIGLHNISARLRLYMNAENALHINSKEGWGTAVRITIPLSEGSFSAGQKAGDGLE